MSAPWSTGRVRRGQSRHLEMRAGVLFAGVGTSTPAASRSRRAIGSRSSGSPTGLRRRARQHLHARQLRDGRCAWRLATTGSARGKTLEIVAAARPAGAVTVAITELRALTTLTELVDYVSRGRQREVSFRLGRWPAASRIWPCSTRCSSRWHRATSRAAHAALEVLPDMQREHRYWDAPRFVERHPLDRRSPGQSEAGR